MTIDKETLSGSSVAMEPLYERLLSQKFASSTDAIEFCREACLEYGFAIKQEANPNQNIYIYCAHVKQLDTKQTSQRKRSSSIKASECNWRVVLTENEFSEWVFRKSLNPNASEHNHHLSDLIWPPQIHERIVQLARQKNLQDDEVHDTIKSQFPDIIWDDRRFLQDLKTERKRIRQKGVTERVQRLIMASTRLCSVVAANEDWASCVEGDLAKMLENYRQLTRTPNHTLEAMVDLELDMIHSEIDKSRRQSRGDENDMVATKKRKAAFIAAASRASGDDQDQSVQIMSVPNYTLFIRSQPLRSLSEPSTQNRRAFTDLIAASTSASSASSIPHHHHHQQQQQHMAATTPFGVSTIFNLTSPVSSPSSTSSIQQRMDYGNTAYSRNSTNSNDMLQSPPIPDPGMMIAPNYGSTTSGSNSGNSGATGHHHHHHPTNANYNTNMYPIQTSYSAYSTSATGDMNFSFDANTMATTPTYHQSRVPSSPAPIMVHRQQQQSSVTAERMTGYPTSMGYYTSSTSTIGGREASSTSIQQRIMLQQEYEQHQRQLQQLDNNSSSGGGNVHLPIIRSNTAATGGVIPTTNQLVQQQQGHSNINHQQSWS